MATKHPRPADDRDALTAMQRARIRRSVAARGGDEEGEGSRELNVVPFLDIITNVMMFVLASIAITFTVTLAVKAPAAQPHGIAEPTHDGLELTVLVLRDGYWVKSRNASIAAGCETTCSGTCTATVPRIAGSTDESIDGSVYDATGLTACVRKLKDALERDAPELAAETEVILSANPDVPFQEVVRAMDALRKDARGELYPHVVLGVWK